MTEHQFRELVMPLLRQAKQAGASEVISAFHLIAPVVPRTFSDGAKGVPADTDDDDTPEATDFSASDLPDIGRYYAAGEDGSYPDEVCRHFNCRPKQFADHTGLVRKQVAEHRDGKQVMVWRWVKPDGDVRSNLTSKTPNPTRKTAGKTEPDEPGARDSAAAKSVGESVARDLSLSGKAADLALTVAAKAYSALAKVTTSKAFDSVGRVLGVVFDTPGDLLHKFGYNPSLSSGTANVTTPDPFRAAGSPVSGHIAARIASEVLSRALLWLRDKATGAKKNMAGGDWRAEAAEALCGVLDAVLAASGLPPCEPAKVAAALEKLAGGKREFAEPFSPGMRDDNSDSATHEGVPHMLAAIHPAAWRGDGHGGDLTPRLAASDYLRALGRDREADILADTSKHAYHDFGGRVEDAGELARQIHEGDNSHRTRHSFVDNFTNRYLTEMLHHSGIHEHGIQDLHPGALAAIVADAHHFRSLHGDYPGADGENLYAVRNGIPVAYATRMSQRMVEHARRMGPFRLRNDDPDHVRGTYEVTPNPAPPQTFADQADVDEMFRQLQRPEHGRHMAGLDDPLGGLRGIAADALDERGRGDEATLLRTPNAHVEVRPDGTVRPSFMERQVWGDGSHEQFVKPSYAGLREDDGYATHHTLNFHFATPHQDGTGHWSVMDADGFDGEDLNRLHPRHAEYPRTDDLIHYTAENHPMTPAELAFMHHHATTAAFQHAADPPHPAPPATFADSPPHPLADTFARLDSLSDEQAEHLADALRANLAGPSALDQLLTKTRSGGNARKFADVEYPNPEDTLAAWKQPHQSRALPHREIAPFLREIRAAHDSLRAQFTLPGSDLIDRATTHSVAALHDRLEDAGDPRHRIIAASRGSGGATLFKPTGFVGTSESSDADGGHYQVYTGHEEEPHTSPAVAGQLGPSSLRHRVVLSWNPFGKTPAYNGFVAVFHPHDARAVLSGLPEEAKRPLIDHIDKNLPPAPESYDVPKVKQTAAVGSAVPPKAFADATNHEALAQGLTMLSSPQHVHTRAGGDHPEADHIHRGRLADLLQDHGREEEAAHLRAPDQHVMVHEGRVVPARYTATHLRDAARVVNHAYFDEGGGAGYTIGDTGFAAAPGSREHTPAPGDSTVFHYDPAHGYPMRNEMHISQVGRHYADFYRNLPGHPRTDRFYAALENFRTAPFEEPAPAPDPVQAGLRRAAATAPPLTADEPDHFADPDAAAPVTDDPKTVPAHFFPEEGSKLVGTRAGDTRRTHNTLVRNAVADKPGTMPGLGEVKAVAQVGDAARGGYNEQYRTMEGLLKSPPDARRWVMANAILSAQTGWEEHTAGAIEALAAWHAAGRPWHPDALEKVFGRTGQNETGGHILIVPGAYKGPATLTGSKVVALRNLFALRDVPDVDWSTISKGSFKTPNFGKAFVSPKGAPIDTHMAKLLSPGYTRSKIEAISGPDGSPAAASKLLDAQKKVIERPAVVLAYKTLLAKAAQELGWDLNQTQEAVWTGALAVMTAMNHGADPKAPSILKKLNRRAVQSGWSLNTVLAHQKVQDDLASLPGVSKRRILSAIAASEARVPAGPGSVSTGDGAALESAALRLPRDTPLAARPIAARLSDGVTPSLADKLAGLTNLPPAQARALADALVANGADATEVATALGLRQNGVIEPNDGDVFG